jgi:hypothetical protein
MPFVPFFAGRTRDDLQTRGTSKYFNTRVILHPDRQYDAFAAGANAKSLNGMVRLLLHQFNSQPDLDTAP